MKSLVLSISLLGLNYTAFAQVPAFEDVAQDAGLIGVNSSWGGAFGDYDNDGDLDLMTIGHLQGGTDSISQFWRNNGDGTFSDITTELGLFHLTGDSHGVGWADFDNDGDLDLYLSNGTLKLENSKLNNDNRLWRNDGPTGFVDIAGDAGVKGIFHRSRSVTMADFNNDGFTDIFNPAFNYLTSGLDEGNSLFINSGVMTFTDIGVSSGVERLDEENRTGSAVDYNGDGLVDLMVVYPCGLFQNQGNEQFVEVTQTVGIVPSLACQSTSWADYDHDGDFDLFVANGGESNADLQDILYANDGDGNFTNVTEQANLMSDHDGRGVIWGDINNDGWEDIYIAGMQNQEQPNLLWLNNGDGTFTDVTEQAGVGGMVEGAGADATMVDYDNDGFLDIFVSNGEGIKAGPYLLYKNSGNDNGYLKINLVGVASNRDAWMSQIDVITAAQASRHYLNNGPSHFMNQDKRPVHIGLADEAGVTAMTVTWPNGLKQKVENIAANQVITITEGESLHAGLPTRRAAGFYLGVEDGQWQLFWLGDQDGTTFSGSISSRSGQLSDVSTLQFDEDDTIAVTESEITFTASSTSGESLERILFSTSEDVQFDLYIDGVADPTRLSIGGQGVKPMEFPVAFRNN